MIIETSISILLYLPYFENFDFYIENYQVAQYYQ